MWTQIDDFSRLVHISVGPNGEIWGVNEHDQVWYLASKDEDWERIDGELIQIDIGANGLVAGVTAS